ncbi:saposin-related protein [Acrasis kona]|uniref:Saposin-related protein n=1 Tax=Acrasis kona TaxID=1008807 RepID=A0AAW2ZNB6_9EUKA
MKLILILLVLTLASLVTCAIPLVQVKERSNGLECVACEVVMNAVEQWVVKESTVAKAVDIISNTVCPHLEPKIKAVCPKIIAQFGPTVFKVLIERENPTVLCRMMRLCQ